VVDDGGNIYVADTENDRIQVFSDRVLSSMAIPLAAGWNMVGSVCGDPVAVSLLSDKPSGSILDSAVYWWNPTGKAYAAAGQIEQGKGYWVATTVDCGLTMAASPA